jgi:hypothetical protein
VRTTILTTPRPVPGKLLPTVGALLVLGIALAVFLVAGWNISAWALGAVLWAGIRAVSLLLTRMRGQMRSRVSSGLLAFELGFKTVAVLAVLVAAAASDPHLALGAALVYALAYTFDLALSLAAYFGGPAA